MYKLFFKRLIDFSISLIALVILSPLMVLLGLILLVYLKGSPFFTQLRPGKNERIFRLIKFKTMNDKRDAQGNLLPDNVRLTGFGRFLRSTSLDELPQLLNVFKGDMSLIGPRPLLVRYLPLYSDFEKRRHEVRPGITGWAQVNGRNTLGWDSRFAYDVWYVDHVGFLLDLKILWLTVLKVIKREGISGDGAITMKPFEGAKSDF